MSTTIPVELDGNEYISEVVSATNPNNHHQEYYVKINGDPACYVNYERVEGNIIREIESSNDLTAEFKNAVKKALENQLVKEL